MVNLNSLDREKRGPSMSARGRLGGLTTSSTHDMSEMAATARKGLASKFENQVDPDRVLSPEERERRVEAARKLHYLQMAQKSAKVRRERARGK